MTRSRGTATAYFLAAYLAASALTTVILLMAALAGMKLLFLLGRFIMGPESIPWIKPRIYDSFGFALASCGTALAQYYIAGHLVFFGTRRRAAAMVLFASILCGLVFWRGALLSALGAYGFSGLSITMSALIGGLAAVLRKPADNPWMPCSR